MSSKYHLRIRDYFLLGFLISLFVIYGGYYLIHSDEINFQPFALLISNLIVGSLSTLQSGFGSFLGGLLGIFIIFCLIGLYFLPTLVSRKRRHKNYGAIAALNLLLGWSFLGWTLALIWALMDPDDSKTKFSSVSSIDKLSQLSSMKAQGLISQAEFESKKAKVLDNF